MARYEQNDNQVHDRNTGYVYSAETIAQATYLRRRLEETEDLKKDLQDAATDLANATTGGRGLPTY